MTLLRTGLAAAALAALGSCASPREAPRPARAPAPALRPFVPTPVPVMPAVPWIDAPLAPGDWREDGSEALYGLAGAPSFAVRCAGPGRIVLMRFGAASAPAMIVRTTTATRTLPGRAAGAGVEAALAASDPLLDAMLFSRGRYSVEVPGEARLIVPSWPEPARVIEDCRG